MLKLHLWAADRCAFITRARARARAQSGTGLCCFFVSFCTFVRPRLFSLLRVSECWTIGRTGGRSTSPPSVRFHYKQCWRWVAGVSVHVHVHVCGGVGGGSPLDICGPIWMGGWDTNPPPSVSVERRDVAKRPTEGRLSLSDGFRKMLLNLFLTTMWVLELRTSVLICSFCCFLRWRYKVWTSPYAAYFYPNILSRASSSFHICFWLLLIYVIVQCQSKTFK